MSDPAGFNLEKLINPTSLREEAQVQEPKVEQLKGKLRRLQQDNRALEEELKEMLSVSASLQKELATLHTEAYKLEGIHKEKEEVCRKLQFQCEESEQECSRQLNQNRKSEERLDQYRCEIQQIKLKQRNQRMKFEKQLHQLIEQHKNLHSVFTAERLPDEIKIAENTNRQLFSAEQLKLDQLRVLDEELIKKMQMGKVTAEEE